MANEDQIIAIVIEKYGPVLDLNERPDALIDILRRFRVEDDPDGGLPPGGPPPGPTSFSGDPTNGELMREILNLSREVVLLRERLGGLA